MAASAAPVVCIDENVLMACLGTKTDHVKLDSLTEKYILGYVFLTKIMRDNLPPPIYAILHGAVSCKGYFALALVTV